MADQTPVEESLRKLQEKAQSLLLNSGYHRSLVRFHSSQADDFDSQIDTIAKKIRTLETNMPKPTSIKQEATNVSSQEIVQSAIG